MAAYRGLVKKQIVFDDLRQALSITLPNTTIGLNDAGNNSMRKKLQSIIADTPLVKNLENHEYLQLMLNGKGTLEEAFTEISQQDVTSKMK